MSRSPDSGPVLPQSTIPDDIQSLPESEILSETSSNKGNIFCVLDRYKVSRADDT